jgi:hypothetical protein
MYIFLLLKYNPGQKIRNVVNPIFNHDNHIADFLARHIRLIGLLLFYNTIVIKQYNNFLFDKIHIAK